MRIWTSLSLNKNMLYIWILNRHSSSQQVLNSQTLQEAMIGNKLLGLGDNQQQNGM